MTDEEATRWLEAQPDVSREAIIKLDALAALVVEENARQNLISPASIDSIIARHIVDGVQLGQLAGNARRWLDIGSGGGFPGLALATVYADRHFTLAEPRALRAEFLMRAVEHLGLENVTVVAARVQNCTGAFNAITARAVAPPIALFDIASHLAQGDTIWVLPVGRSAQKALKEARRTWQGEFHVKRSVTDADSGIIVASHVKGRSK